MRDADYAKFNSLSISNHCTFNTVLESYPFTIWGRISSALPHIPYKTSFLRYPYLLWDIHQAVCCLYLKLAMIWVGTEVQSLSQPKHELARIFIFPTCLQLTPKSHRSESLAVSLSQPRYVTMYLFDYWRVSLFKSPGFYKRRYIYSRMILLPAWCSSIYTHTNGDQVPFSLLGQNNPAVEPSWCFSFRSLRLFF